MKVRLVQAVVTTWEPKRGRGPSPIVKEVHRTWVRTRLVYEGRPMFLAADPVAEPEEVAS